MAGKAKFDQEAAFKSIVGVDRQPAPEPGAAGQPVVAGGKNKDRVQRSYFIDRDLDKEKEGLVPGRTGGEAGHIPAGRVQVGAGNVGAFD